MLEMWYSDRCGKCQARNFIRNGDPANQTVDDVGGIKCWQCGHCWRIGGSEEEIKELDSPDEDDSCYNDGRHFVEVDDAV